MAKIVRYQTGDVVAHGLLEDHHIRPLEGNLDALRSSSAPGVELHQAKLLSPTVPSKIVAIGPNFRAYFSADKPPPSQPMLWIKPATCLNHPEGMIELPPGHIVNHESELALVIGKTAREVGIGEARSSILGYSCMNDVTAGDFATRGHSAHRTISWTERYSIASRRSAHASQPTLTSAICISSAGSTARFGRAIPPRISCSRRNSSSRWSRG